MLDFDFARIIAILGVIGAIISALGIIRSTRRSKTLDLLLKHESDDFYNQISNTFFRQAESSEGLVYKKPSSKIKSHIISYLNHHEIIAAGIYDGALDEAMCKRFMKTIIVKDFEKSKEYIKVIRKKYENKKLFIEFEGLHDKWKAGKNYQKIHRWLW